MDRHLPLYIRIGNLVCANLVAKTSEPTMKGLNYILYICYGNHAKVSKNKSKAEELIILLRSRHSVERSEAMEYLGFDPESDNEVRRFDRLLSPLRGNNDLNVEVVSGFTRDGEKHYSLSKSKFDACMRNDVIKSVRDALGEDENERIKELNSKVESLERELGEMQDYAQEFGQKSDR